MVRSPVSKVARQMLRLSYCEENPAWFCISRASSVSLFSVGLLTCQTKRPRRLLEIRLIRPLSLEARAMYLEAV